MNTLKKYKTVLTLLLIFVMHFFTVYINEQWVGEAVCLCWIAMSALFLYHEIDFNKVLGVAVFGLMISNLIDHLFFDMLYFQTNDLVGTILSILIAFIYWVYQRKPKIEFNIGAVVLPLIFVLSIHSRASNLAYLAPHLWAEDISFAPDGMYYNLEAIMWLMAGFYFGFLVDGKNQIAALTFGALTTLNFITQFFFNPYKDNPAVLTVLGIVILLGTIYFFFQTRAITFSRATR